MKDKPMARRYLETTLELIDENHGVTGVDLRKVSRSLGCAHTNIYNYFDNYADLLWHALVEVVERLMEHTKKETAGIHDKRSAFRIFIGSQVDFALAHPGWYRFLWMDPLKGEPSEDLIPKLTQPAIEFARYLASFAPDSVPGPTIARAADIVHGLVHGTLSRMVAGRYAFPTSDQREKIIADAELVFELLCSENSNSPKGTEKQ